MRKRTHLLGVIALCLAHNFTNAQTTTTDCNVNVHKALFYLKESKFYKKDKKKALELLQPCLEAQNDYAQLIKARLLLNSNEETQYQEAFKLLKASAEQGNAIAMADLGELYKYGKGCNLNFNKAKKWYTKAQALGNDKAAYSLGYIHLKGLGNTKQDYTEAVKWFKKSKYPMAKYWLGVCNYFGYGTPKNSAKANQLLGTNFKETVNSNATTESNNKTAQQKANLTDEAVTTITQKTISNTNLKGTWQGNMLLLDWSGTAIEHSVPVSLTFTEEETNGTLQITWGINNKEVAPDFTQIENSLYYDNFTLNLPHTSFKKEIPSTLKHDILQTSYQLKKIAGITYLTGAIETYIPAWKEQGVPMRFVLTKKETTINTNIELSEEVLQALATQKDDFIQLYPNPFEKDLIVSYDLATNQTTEVKIADINGNNERIVRPTELQEAGTHRYFIEATDLPSGLYVVTVTTNNKRNTKIIVKK
ncbi:Por_Secre_tail domain-containing protein [Tenacibaculum sp. 190524A02b]|uniref:Por_Secre_tail domain-containing protein n=1 Tax=Tenacibaculum vairaonense TaxID=3137860 RepID=A0ABP1FBN6_9FLAO